MRARHVMIAALAACATPAMAAESNNAPVAIPAPPGGKGQIVFFRPGGMGFALGCSVNENGQKVSSLGAGTYFVMVTNPGKHEFAVKSEATDKLTLEIEPDETQFAKCRIKMGIMVGRPDLAPATEDEFRKMKRPKLVDAEDMGPGPGALRPDELAAALAAPAPAVTPALAGPATPEAGQASQPSDNPAVAPVAEDGATATADDTVKGDAPPAADAVSGT